VSQGCAVIQRDRPIAVASQDHTDSCAFENRLELPADAERDVLFESSSLPGSSRLRPAMSRIDHHDLLGRSRGRKQNRRRLFFLRLLSRSYCLLRRFPDKINDKPRWITHLKRLVRGVTLIHFNAECFSMNAEPLEDAIGESRVLKTRFAVLALGSHRQ